MTGQTPDPIGTDPIHLTTDAAKEDALISQDHTANTTMAEALATIRGMHPNPHPTTAAACDTQQLSNAVGDNLAGIHHSGTTMTHL